jgi:hypothetical protein
MSLCRSKTRRNQMAGLSIQDARGTEMICWDMDTERRWMNICARTWMLQANTWVASCTAAVLLGMANCSKLKTLSSGQLRLTAPLTCKGTGTPAIAYCALAPLTCKASGMVLAAQEPAKPSAHRRPR